MHRAVTVALPLALSAVLATACSDPPAAAGTRPRLVLLVIVDALRADHLGCYGYARPTSPALDAFAGTAVRFERAFAASSWTKPSIPSLLTGRLPSEHGVFEGNSEDTAGRITSDVLPDDAETLSEVLRSAGYRTAAFVKNAQLKPFLGFAQGFDVYEEGVGDASAIHARFLEWYDAARAQDADAPLFAYLHVLDVHWPYAPPAGARAEFPPPAGARDLSVAAQKQLRDRVNDGLETLSDADRAGIAALYDACIRGYDGEFARLREELLRRSAWQDALIVFTSDHGEELGERGQLGHGHSLSEVLLRVPLLVRLPGASAGSTEPAVVSHLDLLPTLALRCRASAPEGLPGSDLLGPRSGDQAFAELLHGRTYERSVRTDSYKLIERYRYLGGGAGTGTTAGPQVGQRAEAKGEFDGSTLDAESLSYEDSDDGDVEIRGPLDLVDAERGLLRIGPFELLCDPRLEVNVRDGAATTLGALKRGDVVDADGAVAEPFRFRVEKLELRRDKAGSDTVKIEGPIERVDGSRKVVLARTEVELGGATAVTGFAGRAAAGATGRALPRSALAEALLADPRVFEASARLFRLRDDPEESRDVAVADARALEGLRDLLLASGRTKRALASSTLELDASTAEELRQIGYVK